MEGAAPSILIRQGITVASQNGRPRRWDWQREHGLHQNIALFAPIEARMRDENLNSADEQRNEADRRDPVCYPYYGVVSRSSRCGRESRVRGREPNRIGHLANDSSLLRILRGALFLLGRGRWRSLAPEFDRLSPEQ